MASPSTIPVAEGPRGNVFNFRYMLIPFCLCMVCAVLVVFIVSLVVRRRRKRETSGVPTGQKVRPTRPVASMQENTSPRWKDVVGLDHEHLHGHKEQPPAPSPTHTHVEDYYPSPTVFPAFTEWKVGRSSSLVYYNAEMEMQTVISEDQDWIAQQRSELSSTAMRCVESTSTGLGCDMITHALGVQVLRVDIGTPAWAAGLLEGDLIIRFCMRNVRTAQDIYNILLLSHPGLSTTIIVNRQSAGANENPFLKGMGLYTLPVTLGCQYTEEELLMLKALAVGSIADQPRDELFVAEMRKRSPHIVKIWR